MSSLLNLAVAALLCLALLGDRGTVERLFTLLPIVPEEQQVDSTPGQLVLKADPRGHYLTRAQVNGRPVRFLIDTGASHVVLSAADAEGLGLRVSRRDFTEIYSTPGGMVRAAPIVLDEVRIGDLVVRNVRASISQQPMDISLLGASFLARLGGYDVSRGRMTLRW